MSQSYLYQKLKAENLDLEQLLSSYYSGGMSDPCQLQPDNVLVFFNHHPKLLCDTKIQWHQRYQLKFNIGEESVFGIDDMLFNMKPDQGILIFPYQYHYVASGNKPGERHHLTISFSDVGDGYDSVSLMRNHVFQVDAADYPLLTQIIGTFQKRTGGDPGEACGCLRLFLTRKLRQIQQSPIDNRAGRDPFAEKLLKQIRENYDQTLNVKSMSELLNISPSHLRRLTKEHFNGLTLGNFLRGIRMCHAFELLLHTDLPISEIARKCGYADLFSFSRAFKLSQQQSPSEFRRQMR